jgi:hypothetical protein
MVLWKKKVNGWPPDDPPKVSGTTIKGIETFGDREKKEYQDSLKLYKEGLNNIKIANNTSGYKHSFWFHPKLGLYERGNNITPFDNWDGNIEQARAAVTHINSRGSWAQDEKTLDILNAKNKPIKIAVGAGDSEGWYGLPVYKKPTGNGLFKPIAKVPTIKPNIPTELPKLPMRPQPQGNVELQNTGYTWVGVKKKPDGTRFIYDRSGKTDKTVIIDDNRIGFEHYIKKLYE